MVTDLAGKIVLLWDTSAGCSSLLEPGAVDTVVAPRDIRVIRRDDAVPDSQPAAVDAGAWPGAEGPGRTADGAFVAGATQRAWVTANGYLVRYLRALYPERAPLLACTAPAGQFDALELALVDAWCAGGNFLLSPSPAHRDALLAGDKPALDAWSRMGRTARWLKQNRALFAQPAPTAITVLVERGDATAEIAQLMFRESGSPDLVAALRLPAPDPARRAVIVAAGIDAPPRDALLAHARAGATVVTDRPWRVSDAKRTRAFEDREFYSLGRGRIVAYKDAVADPGEFARDAIDLAAERRPARIWNCPAAIAMAFDAGPRSRPGVHVVNYGAPVRSEVLVRRYGVFASATMLRPEAGPLPLRTYRRGTSTEVALPAVGRMASVVFEGGGEL